MQKQPNISGEYVEIQFPSDISISYFKHTQGYQTKEDLHFHNGVEIGICLEGNGVFFIGNQVFPFSKGDVSVIMPNQPHIAQSPNDKPSRWNFMTVDIERMGLHNSININSVISDRNISNLAEMLFEELNNKLPQYKEMVKILFEALCIKTSRLDQLPKRMGDDNNVQLDLIIPALNYISKNYMLDIKIGELAHMCNLSVTHFRRLFKRLTTLSPLSYIFEVRLKMATVLLESTSRSISDISIEVGYQTISSFNRNFKDYYDMCPRDWRNIRK